VSRSGAPPVRGASFFREGMSLPAAPRHPGIRVLAVLLVGMGVMALPSPAGLAATAALVAFLLAPVAGAGAVFLRLAGRLKWVFLFIVLLHGWFTPGGALVAGGGPWWPTVEGLARGAELVAVIVLMVGLVAVLVRTTPSPELAAGVAWLLAPLGRLGVPVERFGRLVAWTLDRVEAVREESGRVRDALRLRSNGEEGVMVRLRLEARIARAVLGRAREAADRNAEALYLRNAGSVRRAGRPGSADGLLTGGAAAWLGFLVWLSWGAAW